MWKEWGYCSWPEELVIDQKASSPLNDLHQWELARTTDRLPPWQSSPTFTTLVVALWSSIDAKGVRLLLLAGGVVGRSKGKFVAEWPTSVRDSLYNKYVTTMKNSQAFTALVVAFLSCFDMNGTNLRKKLLLSGGVAGRAEDNPAVELPGPVRVSLFFIVLSSTLLWEWTWS